MYEIWAHIPEEAKRAVLGKSWRLAPIPGFDGVALRCEEDGLMYCPLGVALRAMGAGSELSRVPPPQEIGTRLARHALPKARWFTADEDDLAGDLAKLAHRYTSANDDGEIRDAAGLADAMGISL